MNVVERHFTEPEITIRLTKTELNILRSALYRSDFEEVANGASVARSAVALLYKDIADEYMSL